MRLKAEGFLLLTIAFSSALTFTETLETSVRDKNAKAAFKSTAGNSTEARAPETKSRMVRSLDADLRFDRRSAEIFPHTFTREADDAQEFYKPSLVLKQNIPDKILLGNRNKKEYSEDDYCSKNIRARLEGALNKRFLTSFSEMLGGKRASLAFHGMRGKKSRDYENEVREPEVFNGLPPREFLISSGLMDEPEPVDFPEKSGVESGSEEGLSKRSPYSFQDVKRKKEYVYDLKRAMGFLGMRGKKATNVGGYKRAPQTSFFGMKGKKAQSSGFFGMRGKKASPNAFFGIKGKRGPSGYDFQDFSLLNQVKESGSSNNRFRRGITWLNNSKKAKNAFFGIRGKKSTPEIRAIELLHLKETKEIVALEEMVGNRFVVRNRGKMRFRFCGDLDCPDWVLAEINTLSKMSSIKVKMLCQVVAKSLTGNEFDEEKAMKLVLDSKLDADDMKAGVAALSLILNSSARYAVEEDVLYNELQQLGLPKEHATALCKIYSEHLTRLTENLEKLSFRTSTLEEASCSIRDLGKEKIDLNLRINDKIQNVTSSNVITMTSEQLALLLTDLKTAREEMKSLPN